ncbi:MAG: winged helix-turn-helix transcriptional regulator [Caldisericia bacterium]|nr:winged helix-turn-helix transcriptional regulator [Caldisericia bacterium]
MKVPNEIIRSGSIWDEPQFKSLRDKVGDSAVMVVAMIHLGYLLKQTGDKLIFAPFGLTTESYEVLFMIRERDKLRPSDIAKCTLMHPAKTTRVLDMLIDKKYIERIFDKQDRRSYHLLLTDSGQNMLKKCDNALTDNVSAMNDIFSNEEYEWLMNIIYAISKENERMFR